MHISVVPNGLMPKDVDANVIGLENVLKVPTGPGINVIVSLATLPPALKIMFGINQLVDVSVNLIKLNVIQNNSLMMIVLVNV